MTLRALPVLLLLAAALAGCAGGGPASGAGAGEDAHAAATAGNETTPRSTGSLLVVVMTPDLEPIAGAQVTVDDTTHTTDATGSARVGALGPGTRIVHASAEGYRSAQALARVVAGEEARVDMKLLQGEEAGPGAAGEVYRQQFPLKGFFDCSATYLIITGDCMTLVDYLLVNQTGSCGPPCPGDATNEQFVLEFPLDAGWQSIVAEMHWKPSTTGSDVMTFAVEPADAPTDGHAPKYARAAGESPLILRIENGVPHPTADASADGEEPEMPQEEGGEVLRTRSFVQGHLHNPGGTEFLGLGIALQQEFDVIVTVFYGEPAPPDFTAQG